ncbi:MAG: glycosyltransferase family 39 protein [Planctomycetota bacterium]
MEKNDPPTAPNGATAEPGPRAIPHWLWIAGILLLALGLRVAQGASRDGIWRDEAQDWYLVTEAETYGDLVTSLEAEGPPPLHYFMEKAVLDVFGASMGNLIALQVVLGTILVGLMIFVGTRCFGRATGYLAGLLTATSPFFIYYSTEPRNYSLFGILSLLHALAFLRFVNKPRARTAALWGASAGAMMLTHYYAIHVIVAAGVFFLLRERTRRGFMLATIAGATCVAVFSPWLPSFFIQSGQDLQPWAWPHLSSRFAIEALRLPFGQKGIGVMAAGLILGIALLRGRTKSGHPAPVVAFSALLSIALISGLTAWMLQLHHGPFNPRYLIGSAVCLVPVGCFYFAQCLSGEVTPRQRVFLRRVGAAGVALSIIFQWSDNGWTRPRTGMKKLVQRLEREERPEDLVWVGPANFGSNFFYYYSGAATVITPPYRERVTRISWAELPTLEEDGPLMETFFADVKSQLDSGGRVWLVLHGLVETSRQWAFREGPSNTSFSGARMLHAEYHIHRRLMRLLFTHGIVMERADWPNTKYWEAVTLMLFRPRVPGDPPLADAVESG